MRVAAATPRAACSSKSSRSSSAAASSLRLVKMSATPRDSFDEDLARPSASRRHHERLAAGASIGAASATAGASLVTASPPNQRRSNPDFWPISVFSLKDFHASWRSKRASTSYGPMNATETSLSVLYRDALMLVIDKPAGVAVHAGPKGGPSLEDRFDELRFGLPRPPALAHRLDRDTSGCLVLGRHRKALAKLGLLFKHGKISKTYWALVAGGPVENEGAIDAPLGRLDAERGWWMKIDPAGQRAETLWQVRGRGVLDGAPVAWMELTPLTGRTHQLRVHCAHSGWPILGDPVYGDRSKPEARLNLLARSVRVPLYSGRP